jgi:hypothetical protein
VKFILPENILIQMDQLNMDVIVLEYGDPEIKNVSILNL